LGALLCEGQPRGGRDICKVCRKHQAKIEAGTLAPVEIYKAEAEAAIREERFLSARKAVFDAEDTLRAIMNTTEWHGEIVPVEVPPEPAPAPALAGLMEDAFANRRDLKRVDTELKSREIMRNYYKNQMLPEFNVVGSAGLSGLSDSFGSAIDSTSDGNFYNWKVGLVFELPIGNRAKKGQYLRAKNEAERAVLKVEQIKQQITVDVRTVLRAVELARESVRASGRSRVASEKRLEAEEERFRLGMATLNDVLTFQQEYADAISSEKRAIADYASASVSLRRASGTLLLHNED
jgi:outer membrane protein TolC